MKCKALQVKVEFELHAITCPGVWLCPSGMVSAQIFMLNSCIRSSLLEPIFPMLCHEKYQFKKIFYGIKNLKDIDNYLWKEELYIELVQWKNLEVGNVLAFFQTTLAELLYPPSTNKCLSLGVDVDLLMEATDRFPGIIAPKLEVSTKTTIEEILCTCPPNKNYKLHSDSCKPLFKNSCKRSTPIRQKKVCHSYDYHMIKMGISPNYYSDDEDFSNYRKCDSIQKTYRRPKTCNEPKKKTFSKVVAKCRYEQPEEYNYNLYKSDTANATKKIDPCKDFERACYFKSLCKNKCETPSLSLINDPCKDIERTCYFKSLSQNKCPIPPLNLINDPCKDFERNCFLKSLSKKKCPTPPLCSINDSCKDFERTCYFKSLSKNKCETPSLSLINDSDDIVIGKTQCERVSIDSSDKKKPMTQSNRYSLRDYENFSANLQDEFLCRHKNDLCKICKLYNEVFQNSDVSKSTLEKAVSTTSLSRDNQRTICMCKPKKKSTHKKKREKTRSVSPGYSVMPEHQSNRYKKPVCLNNNEPSRYVRNSRCCNNVNINLSYPLRCVTSIRYPVCLTCS